MKFSNIDSRRTLPGRDGNGELVTNVGKLVDSFVRSEGDPAFQPDSSDKTVAGNALLAAALAERQICELSDRIEELEQLAMTDELTGLMNRRGLEVELNRALSSARRNEERGILIYIDLDDFKPVNDRNGHAAGDEVLRHVGRVLSENVRDTDYISRLGGDEFAVLMPRTLWTDGLSRAGVIEKCLNAASINWQGRRIGIQASLGLQSYAADSDPAELLKMADAAMYKTKRLRSGLVDAKINQTKVNHTPTGGSLQHFLYAAS